MTSLSYTVTPEDFIAYAVHASGKPPFLRRYRIRWLLSGLAFAIALGATAMALGAVSEAEASAWLPLLVGAVVACEAAMWIAAPVMQRVQVRAAARATLGATPSGTFLGPHRLEATPAALLDEGTLVRSAVSWQAVRSLEETPDHLFIVAGGSQAFIVPKRGLDPAAVQVFKAAVEAAMLDHGQHGAATRSAWGKECATG